MLSGARALILYADGCPRSQGTAPPTPALDRVVSEGISGWLALRRPAGCRRSRAAALGQILGVMPTQIAAAGGDMAEVRGFETGEEQKTLRDRYGGLEVRIVSDCAEAFGLSALGVVCEPAHAEGPDAATQLAAQVRACYEDRARPAHLVVLHLHSCGDAARHANALRALDSVAAEIWGDGNTDELQVVVLGADEDVEDGPLRVRGAPESDPPTASSAAAALRPVQSSEMHNGRRLDAAADGREQRAVYGLHHPRPPFRTKWTRLVHLSVLTGHVSSLSPRCTACTTRATRGATRWRPSTLPPWPCAVRTPPRPAARWPAPGRRARRALMFRRRVWAGGNGGSLAQHLLGELAFLLGTMPKYGA
jgi:hypothetical protein